MGSTLPAGVVYIPRHTGAKPTTGRSEHRLNRLSEARWVISSSQPAPMLGGGAIRSPPRGSVAMWGATRRIGWRPRCLELLVSITVTRLGDASRL